MAELRSCAPSAVLLLLAPTEATPAGVLLQIDGHSAASLAPRGASEEMLQLAGRLLQATQDWLAPTSAGATLAPRVAAARSQPAGEPRPLKAGPFQVSGPHRLVRWRGPKGWRPVDLTDIERRLLCQLLAGAGRVCSRSDIAAGVWGAEAHNLRTVDQCVRRLRRSMVAAGVPDCIKTVRGIGYRLVPAVADQRGDAAAG